MGLDIFLTYRKILSPKEKLVNFLEDDKERESFEIDYWRKELKVVEVFGKVLGIGIENVTDYIVTKEQLEEIKDILQAENISDVSNISNFLNNPEINFDKIEIIFSIWY